MTFAQFMELALYHPTLGYYRGARQRVGYERGTDFFTASTSGPIFGELIVAACVQLLGGRDPHDYTFVEIGAEAGADVLNSVTHPFAARRTIAVGESIELSGRCVIFSNELFDAQPFRRFVFGRGAWHELGVAGRDAGLVEIEFSPANESFLPANAPEGYVLDAPMAAPPLLRGIVEQPWSGLFIACDYGKTWKELVEAVPAGTARAYYQHTQSNDLLARPGEQDLTCHVCWDWLIEVLTRNRFGSPVLESQEAFFVRHAADFIAATTAAEAAHFSRKKLSLMQLLHPAHLGQKFQVLHGFRE
jgi:SAM-dependent MidA family methyltransferase